MPQRYALGHRQAQARRVHRAFTWVLAFTSVLAPRFDKAQTHALPLVQRRLPSTALQTRHQEASPSPVAPSPQTCPIASMAELCTLQLLPPSGCSPSPFRVGGGGGGGGEAPRKRQKERETVRPRASAAQQQQSSSSGWRLGCFGSRLPSEPDGRQLHCAQPRRFESRQAFGSLKRS